MQWSDDNVELLRKTLADGASAAEAARAIGCSRNSIIGVAHRKNIQFTHHRHGGRPATPKKPRQPRTTKFRPRPIQTHKQVLLPPEFLCVGLSKLKDSQCHFPEEIDGRLAYCGQPTDSQYCAYHAQIIYRRAA